MNPKVFGTHAELKERARQGMRRRKRMNESNYKKLRRTATSLASVFAVCTLAAAGLTKDLVSAPFENTLEAFQPFVNWATEARPKKEVECLELFAGQPASLRLLLSVAVEYSNLVTYGLATT